MVKLDNGQFRPVSERQKAVIKPIVSSLGTNVDLDEVTEQALSTWEGEGGALGVNREEEEDEQDALSTWEGEGGALGVG